MNKKKIFSSYDFISIGKKVISIEIDGIKRLSQYIDHNFVHACEILLHCKGNVIVTGIGKSGYIGKKLSSTFASIGISSFFIHPCEAYHGDLGAILKRDIVIILSNSGTSHEVLMLIPFFKKLKIPIICITGNPNSEIGKKSNICLCIHVPKEACPLGLIPTTSTTSMMIMGDALVISILKAKGITAKDFFLSHPGGELGRKLRDFHKKD